ncbi:hypothetical protein FA13DRAFT_1575775, partial [Coprinellus micaceus]
DPICSCGRGKDLGGFADVKEWAALKPFVTRLAIGNAIPMSLLKTMPVWHAEKPGQPKLLVCSACKSVRYCSTACQRNHWKQHKSLC